MSESVEQAALARAERDALPAPWGSVLDAMEALSRLNDGRFTLMQAINKRHDDELAEIRDALLTLTSALHAHENWHEVLQPTDEHGYPLWAPPKPKDAA